ncbi:LysR family transcriptional regulator [Rhizobium leguminosarum]|uniref:LysR family transcriptional regulator n=1 Tax=Rhizobium leguminosarum TaxID=384 RepID=UPI001C94BD1C|nr:LysR family transcriptional regulator [Rhizobium leguminosarum]MBY5774857.1 LysR family transcriptional regulator [Rhizobium leguminosarum]
MNLIKNDPSIEDSHGLINPASYDLNLLVVLHALIRSRNLTHASNDLCTSLAATSRALGRLRRLFDDPLLIRHNRTFGLTPLAEALTSKVEAFLVNVDNIFTSNPAPPERFTIVLPDHVGLSLTPSLSGFLRQISPKTLFLPLFNMLDAMDKLEQGQIDLAVGVIEDAPPGFFCRALPPVRSLCVGRKGHEAADRQLQFSELNRYLSIRIDSTFGVGLNDLQDGLEALRIKGGEVLTLPDIHTAARFAEDSDALLVLPNSAAQFLVSRYDLLAFQPKGSLPPPYRVSLIWHERWNRQSLHAGVRSIVASHLLKDFTPT